MTTMTETHISTELKYVEHKLDKLLDQYQFLKNENSSLKSQQEILIQEKAELLEKASLAKARVDALITRLKAMEQSS